MEWQPISTAPQFEAVLIAGGNILYPITASFNLNKIHGPFLWEIEAQGEFWCDGPCNLEPTHWATLPAFTFERIAEDWDA
jgi:hypothetical protein